MSKIDKMLNTLRDLYEIYRRTKKSKIPLILIIPGVTALIPDVRTLIAEYIIKKLIGSTIFGDQFNQESLIVAYSLILLGILVHIIEINVKHKKIQVDNKVTKIKILENEVLQERIDEGVSGTAILRILCINENNKPVVLRKIGFKTVEHWDLHLGVGAFALDPRSKLKRPCVVIKPKMGSIEILEVEKEILGQKQYGININIMTQYILRDSNGLNVSVGFSIFLNKPKLIFNIGEIELPRIITSLTGGTYGTSLLTGIDPNELVKNIDSIQSILRLTKEEDVLCSSNLIDAFRFTVADAKQKGYYPSFPNE